MKSSVIVAALIAVGVILWVASGQFGGDPQPASAAPGVETPAGAPVASTAPVRVQILDSVAKPHARNLLLRGRTEADRVVTISAQTTGVVGKILVEKGARVAAGQVIAQIDSADREARMAQAKAMLQQRQTELKASQALAVKGYSPKLNLADLEAKLALAEADIASMKIDIGYLAIKAPVDGVLEQRPVEIGQYVRPGDLVATIVDLNPILVVGQVAETDVAAVKPGSPAEIRLITGQTLTGSVRFVATMADEVTRTFRIDIAAENADHAVKQGVSAEIALPVAQTPAHLMTPAVLTLNETGSVGVKTVDAQNRVHFVPVMVLGEDAGGVWLGGLPERARIVTVGQEFVIDGQIVVPVPASATAVPPAASAAATGQPVTD